MKNKKEKFFKFEYGDLVRVTNSQNHLYIECVYQFDKEGNAMTDHLVLHINQDGEPTVEEDMGLDDDSFKLLQVWRLNGYQDFELIYGYDVEAFLSKSESWKESTGSGGDEFVKLNHKIEDLQDETILYKNIILNLTKKIYKLEQQLEREASKENE